MFACIYIPNASGDGIASLLECASTFSPRVENTGAGTVVFDVDGLERLFGGYSEIAEKIRDEAGARGLEPNVAIASNADAAVCAARGFSGRTIIPRGTEAARLRDLTLAVLAPSPEISETLGYPHARRIRKTSCNSDIRAAWPGRRETSQTRAGGRNAADRAAYRCIALYGSHGTGLRHYHHRTADIPSIADAGANLLASAIAQSCDT